MNDEGAVLLKSVKDVRARRELPDLCTQYREFASQEAAAKAAKKGIMDEIKVHADRVGHKKIAGDGWTLIKVAEGRGQISGIKLIELGVELHIIDAAYGKRAAYYSVLETA